MPNIDRAIAQIDAKLTTGLTPEEHAQFVALLRYVAEHGGYDEDCAGKPLPCPTDGGDLAIPPCPSQRV